MGLSNKFAINITPVLDIFMPVYLVSLSFGVVAAQTQGISETGWGCWMYVLLGSVSWIGCILLNLPSDLRWSNSFCTNKSAGAGGGGSTCYELIEAKKQISPFYLLRYGHFIVLRPMNASWNDVWIVKMVSRGFIWKHSLLVGSHKKPAFTQQCWFLMERSATDTYAITRMVIWMNNDTAGQNAQRHWKIQSHGQLYSEGIFMASGKKIIHI